MARLTVPTTLGDMPMRPSFPLLLSYEYQIRVKAFELVNEEGYTLTAALRAARKDAETRTLKFVTPLANEGKNKNQDQGSLWREGGQPPRGVRAGKGKGKEKGKVKGKFDKGKGVDSALTNEWNGLQICFKYSNKMEHDHSKCARAHVCQFRKCNGAKHPLSDCKAYKEHRAKAGKGPK